MYTEINIQLKPVQYRVKKKRIGTTTPAKEVAKKLPKPIQSMHPKRIEHADEVVSNLRSF